MNIRFRLTSLPSEPEKSSHDLYWGCARCRHELVLKFNSDELLHYDRREAKSCECGCDSGDNLVLVRFATLGGLNAWKASALDRQAIIDMMVVVESSR